MVPRKVENIKVSLSYTLQNSTTQGSLRWLSGEECLQPSLITGIPFPVPQKEPTLWAVFWPPYMYCIMCAAQCTLVHSEQNIWSNYIQIYALWCMKLFGEDTGKELHCCVWAAISWIGQQMNNQEKSKTGQVGSKQNRTSGICGGHGTGWDSCQSHIWWSHRTQKGCLQLCSKTIWFLTWAFLQRWHTNMTVTHMNRFSTSLVFNKMQTKSREGAGRGEHTLNASTGGRVSWAVRSRPAWFTKEVHVSNHIIP